MKGGFCLEQLTVKMSPRIRYLSVMTVKTHRDMRVPVLDIRGLYLFLDCSEGSSQNKVIILM